MDSSISLSEVSCGRCGAGWRELRRRDAARGRRAARAGEMFRRLDAKEIGIVRRASASSRRPVLRALSIGVTRLGDGWVYAALALLVPALAGWQSARFFLAGSLSAAVCVALYTSLKARLARRRPCDYDRTLESRAKALDQYSFPSGHCMNAAAVGVPLCLSFPAAAPFVAVAWLLLAWSRVALGHHYLSDILCGGLLGSVVALAVVMLVM